MHECLICGATFREPAPDRCVECGHDRFVTADGPHSERRPPEYGPGDHAALLYDSDERCMNVLLPFVRDGVAGGDRVIGVVDDHIGNLLRSHLTSAEARRVEMITPVEQYGDVFSADRTHEAWRGLIAATDGTLRAFGGLDHATAQSVDPAEWGRHERTIGALMKDDALGLCLYDVRYCPPAVIETGMGHSLFGAPDKVHVCR